MKRDSRFLTLNQLRVVALSFAGLACFINDALALTEGSPYGAIPGRNVFALKPPTPVAPVNPQVAVLPVGIELQGFTTILGRPQVLLKVKVPPKPPEPAKDRSLVMDVGQREGEVEVIEMDTRAGVVKLKNQGNFVSLNLKDNAAKPTAGPALPPPGGPAAGGMIPPPLPAGAAPGAGGASPTTIGSPAGGVPGLPTRSIRSGGMNPQASNYGNPGYGNAGASSSSSGSTVSNLSREEQAALILANKEKWKQQGREDIANLLPNPIPAENPQQ